MNTQTLITKLEQVIAKRDVLAEKDKTLETLEKKYRADLMEEMLRTGVVRQQTDKTMFYTSVTKRLEIVDEAAIKTYLEAHGVLETYMNLDKTKVKAFAKKQPDMPGVAETETTSLTVKPIVKEVERTETDKEMMERIRNSKGE